MMRRVLACALVLLLVSGCATVGQNEKSEPSPGKSAGLGAVIGAVIGAVVGAAVGGRSGAAIGAAAGAVIGGISGYAWGEYQRRTVMSRAEALQAVAYTPDQGHRLVIRESYAAPDPVKPGSTILLGGNYVVLAPDPNATVEVKEVREILFNNTVVFSPSEKTATVNQGGEESDEKFQLPSNASEGQYTYRLTVINPATNLSEVRESTFTVIRG